MVVPNFGQVFFSAQVNSPHQTTPSSLVLNHVPYLYVMECQASVLQRGADQQSFDTLQLGSQPCLLALPLVMDCQSWEQTRC